jgi:hypothetical protein
MAAVSAPFPGFERIPRADEIIKTIVASQIRYNDNIGVERAAGWYWAKRPGMRSSLGSTANCIESMRIASVDVNDPQILELCRNLIRSAVESVLLLHAGRQSFETL